jgi:hypothetical protein
MTTSPRFHSLQVHETPPRIQRGRHLRTIRLCIAIVVAGLVFSGLTAFALESELRWLMTALQTGFVHSFAKATHLLAWIQRVALALAATNANYPFLAYGTDWLAFAHLVIATAFIGAYRDPARNQWIVDFGLIACAAVIPLALIAGHVRGIPVGWRLIDCSFGVFAAIPLFVCRRHIHALEHLTSPNVRRRSSSKSVEFKGYHDDDRDWLR